MKILFDGRAFQFQRAGGINRYFSEIISGLPATWVPVVTGVADFGVNIPQHPNLRVENPPKLRPRQLQRLEHFVGRNWWRPKVVRGVSLLHPSYYDLTCNLRLGDFTCPMVTTVYDMIHARFPNQMERAETSIRDQREAVRKAERIVCISRSTERDLVQSFPETAGKTTVIYLGSSFAIEYNAVEEGIFRQPMFLYVGGRGGYKNFRFLLRAFSKAATTIPGIRLGVVGGPFTEEERWEMYFLGITSKVESFVYPTESGLQQLYRQSVALLYPSRYEGFGIPPLEAMACGTIPVTGNTSSLPEVMGNAGIMLNPAAEDDWADCIIKLSQPFLERASLLERGRRQVTQFAWADCARRHVEIYKELIN